MLHYNTIKWIRNFNKINLEFQNCMWNYNKINFRLLKNGSGISIKSIWTSKIVCCTTIQLNGSGISIKSIWSSKIVCCTTIQLNGSGISIESIWTSKIVYGTTIKWIRNFNIINLDFQNCMWNYNKMDPEFQ